MMNTKLGAYGNLGASWEDWGIKWGLNNDTSLFDSIFGTAGKAPTSAATSKAPTATSTYTWAGDFVDYNRTYAYRVWTHPTLPVAFQILQGPPGTTLNKWVKVDSGAPWTAIRAMYQQVNPAKKMIPAMIIAPGTAGYSPGSSGVIAGGGQLPGVGTGGGVGALVTVDPSLALTATGEPKQGVGLGTVLGVGAAATVAVLALYWAFGSGK